MNHCPNVLTNLVSINKLCKDNHYYFILTANSFFVKDVRTGTTLTAGRYEDGLYLIHLTSQSKSAKAPVVFLSVKATFGTWHSRHEHCSSQLTRQILR